MTPEFVTHRVVMKAKPAPDPMPIGTVFETTTNDLLPGYIWPEGQILSRDEYPELWAIVGNMFWPRLRWWQFRKRRARKKLVTERKFIIPDLRQRVVIGVDWGKE